MQYLDHAASSPLRPEAWEAMQPFRADSFGNPSGAHAVSRQAKNALEDARDHIASLMGADPLDIVFTGGGTEADNLAVKGAAFAGVEGVESSSAQPSTMRFWRAPPLRLASVVRSPFSTSTRRAGWIRHRCTPW